jgi:hypothetical protein
MHILTIVVDNDDEWLQSSGNYNSSSATVIIFPGRFELPTAPK